MGKLNYCSIKSCSLVSVVALWSVIGMSLGFQAHADHQQHQTQMDFVDSCTGEPTATSSPNGEKVVIKIEGLDPNRKVWVDFRMGPPDLIDGSQHSKTKKKKNWHSPKVDSQGRGYLELTKKVRIPHPKGFMKEEPIRRIWTARVHWIQEKTGPNQEIPSGSAEASMVVLESDKDLFYEAVNKPVCMWETPVQIQSDYRYNDSEQPMLLSRETRVGERFGKSKGAGLGLLPSQGFGGYNFRTNNPAGTSPLFGSPLGSSVWFFKNWNQVSAFGSYTMVKRTWSLGKEQGGYFGLRYSFTRFPVREFALKKGRFFECSRWQENRRGYLDVGLPELDFYVVPQSMAGDNKLVGEFIEKLRPTANSCVSQNLPQGGIEFRVPDSGEGLSYFYPEHVRR